MQICRVIESRLFTGAATSYEGERTVEECYIGARQEAAYQGKYRDEAGMHVA